MTPLGWEGWTAAVVVALLLYALWKEFAGADVLLVGGALVFVTLSLASEAFPGPARFAANFGNEGVLTVAALFVVAAGLTETGGMSILTERFLGRPRSATEARARLMLPVSGISAFLNNTPVVAMFIPVVTEWSKKTGISPSQLLMPLSFAAVLGGVTTLIGTSTNLVVQGLLVEAQKSDPTIQTFTLFSMTPVGVPVAAAGLGFVLFAARWLLPERKTFLADVANARQYTTEMLVQPGSGLAGLTIEAAGLRRLPGTYLSAIERDGELIAPARPDHVLRANDKLVFVGVVESVAELQRFRGLVPASEEAFQLTASRLNRLLVEAVVSGTSPVIGRTIRASEFRTRYDAAVIAVYRHGERITGKIGDIALYAGDALLLQAHASFVAQHRNNRDFLLVSKVEDTQPVRHHRARAALVVMAGMVLVASLEPVLHVTVFHAALVAAALMGILGCLSAEQARRSLNLPVLVAIVGALTIGQATESTGLAPAIANLIVAFTSQFGTWAVLCGIYLMTLVFTELVTNNAAAALAFPVARATAVALGVDFMPFAIVVTIAASSGFATPLGYQTHLMVFAPGGYKFADFVRMGLPLDILCMIVTVVVTPVVYPF